jgi:uncharacterized membrane protein
MDTKQPDSYHQRYAIDANRFVLWFSTYWLSVVVMLLTAFVLLPFMAPVFMRFQLVEPANQIYRLYAYLCHQLPERSYFLFGSQSMIPLDTIQQIWKPTQDPELLRGFIGTPELGWKIAWSDRMVWMYTSLPFFAMLWIWLPKKFRSIGILEFIVLLLPMLADGISHIISDQAGIGNGFRDQNAWLSFLTGKILPKWFYAGDTWGSFNSWMRILSGILFAIAVVWFLFPYLNDYFVSKRRMVERRFLKAGISY